MHWYDRAPRVGWGDAGMQSSLLFASCFGVDRAWGEPHGFWAKKDFMHSLSFLMAALFLCLSLFMCDFRALSPIVPMSISLSHIGTKAFLFIALKFFEPWLVWLLREPFGRKNNTFFGSFKFFLLLSGAKKTWSWKLQTLLFPVLLRTGTVPYEIGDGRTDRRDKANPV